MTARNTVAASPRDDFLAPDGGPGPVEGFFQPRRLAFWLMVVFLANGVFAVVTTVLVPAYRVVPTAVLFAFVMWALYTLPFAAFVRSLDLFEQHPPLGFALAFGWGGLGAVYLALPANSAIFSILSKTQGPAFTEDWGAAIAGPSVEETLKILGVVLLILVARSQFRTVLSVVVMGATVGLGFQVVEDLTYSINTAIAWPTTNETSPVLVMMLFRGLASGLWSHAMYTAIASFGVGYLVARRGAPLAPRIAIAVASFAVAWSLHFFWNSPFFTDLNLFASMAIKALPVAVVGFLIWRFAGHEEGAHLRALAEHHVSPELVDADERDDLASLRRRRHVRRTVTKAYGRRAGRAQRALQREQVRLVTEIGRGVSRRRVAEQEDAVRHARAHLTTLARGAAGGREAGGDRSAGS